MILLEYFFGQKKDEKEQLTAPKSPPPETGERPESGQIDAREKQLLREAIEAYRRAIKYLDRVA